jgi:hypothetical protein
LEKQVATSLNGGGQMQKEHQFSLLNNDIYIAGNTSNGAIISIATIWKNEQI